MAENDNYEPIPLVEAKEEWLKAWLDAGYMTRAEYDQEMQRRERRQRSTTRVKEP